MPKPRQKPTPKQKPKPKQKRKLMPKPRQQPIVRPRPKPKHKPLPMRKHNEMLKRLEADIAAVRLDGKDVPVKLRVFDSLFVPLAKWSMLLTGNYRCITRDAARPIREAHARGIRVVFDVGIDVNDPDIAYPSPPFDAQIVGERGPVDGQLLRQLADKIGDQGGLAVLAGDLDVVETVQIGAPVFILVSAHVGAALII